MNKILFTSINREHLPFLSLLLALTVLGVAVFSHVSLSQQPPSQDAVQYFVKAKNFWDSISQRKWFNPLNIEPTFRPPGTIVVSYPFGFSEGFHGYYFRSIFLPIVLFVFALWIAAKPSCSTLKSKWLLVSLCLAFSTLPLFYHFERR